MSACSNAVDKAALPAGSIQPLHSPPFDLSQNVGYKSWINQSCANTLGSTASSCTAPQRCLNLILSAPHPYTADIPDLPSSRHGPKNREHIQSSSASPHTLTVIQDPSEVKIIYLRATGGEVGASSALAPKIGPLGLVRCSATLSEACSQTCSSHPRRSEKISRKRHPHGRVCESPSNSRSKTDKRPSRSCPQHPLSSSGLSKVWAILLLSVVYA